MMASHDRIHQEVADARDRGSFRGGGGPPPVSAKDLKLELFVKIRNVETLTLSVYPTISIDEIKEKIESLREIPTNDQILTLNGSDLEDDFKLSRSEIENSIIWLKYR